MGVACFCGCRFSFAGDVGMCPGCGEYVTLTGRVSAPEEQRMRAELDLLLTYGPTPGGRRVRRAGGGGRHGG
jgi:hypothetical protein